MRTPNLLVVCCLVGCAVLCQVTPAAAAAAAEPTGRPGTGDGELIQGRWRMAALNREGRKLSEDQLTRLGGSMRFSRDRVTQAAAGAPAQDGTFVIDPAKKPKRLTIKPKAGGQPQELIYELDGDRLRLASQIGDGADPPPDFEPGRGRIVMTLERQKD